MLTALTYRSHNNNNTVTVRVEAGLEILVNGVPKGKHRVADMADGTYAWQVASTLQQLVDGHAGTNGVAQVVTIMMHLQMLLP